ncbi:MAG: hypothetical protein ACYSWP_02200 [Planctomycetota bacterium]|jgi:hypothetical protein
MSVTLDGSIVFDGHGLEIELSSIGRESKERTVPGLDGVISVDLGDRGRKIKQKGTLRARSLSELQDKIDGIEACIDGEAHTLVTEKHGELSDLRMDSFKTKKHRTSGSGVSVDYEIVYRQLVV